tara:strand:+ start:48180 stop:49163 length:984 start_codon:yes stop_codon:yes gene_type:complete
LTLWLTHLGADVTGYSLAPPTRPNFFNAVGLAEGIASITGDIRKLNFLSAAMRECDPQIVIHLAAQPLVREAFASPIETFSTNVMGTVNVLQAMRGCDNLDAAVIFTTDKVYENTETGTGYREDARLGGREPYGASKACSEIAVEAYRQSYFDRGVPVATVRAGNIIGGGDWSADRIVPDAVRAFGGGHALKIRNPDAVRPWQHALDPARGVLLLTEKLVADKSAPACWNFGPTDENAVTVGTVADIMTKLWGNGASWETTATPNAPYEAKLLGLDSSLAQARLGWQPNWSLERALNATVDWYQGFLARKDMRALSLAQITAMQGVN